MTETQNTARQYRKRLGVIEAIRVTGKNWLEVEAFIGKAGEFPAALGGAYLSIKTLEGDMLASTGDWIVEGTQGEFYPVKDSIFQATYEAVDE